MGLNKSEGLVSGVGLDDLGHELLVLHEGDDLLEHLEVGVGLGEGEHDHDGDLAGVVGIVHLVPVNGVLENGHAEGGLVDVGDVAVRDGDVEPAHVQGRGEVGLAVNDGLGVGVLGVALLGQDAGDATLNLLAGEALLVDDGDQGAVESQICHVISPSLICRAHLGRTA